MSSKASSATPPRPAARRARVILGMLGIATLTGAVLYFGVIHPAQLRSQVGKATAKARKQRKQATYKRPAQSVIARTGLPNLRAKLAARAPVTVAFLGGSITQNGGQGGFVSEVPAWIAAQVPGIHVETINAGKAATGSDRGAQRIDHDVLLHKPDVVFVEFAVNDSDRECTADMERIVRKIRLADPHTDIVFLYCVMDWTLPRLESGKFPPSVIRHEMVAEHYGIPTVALGSDAARKIHLGEWTWASFSADACHPTPDGYASYNRDIDAALPQLVAVPGPASRPLPPGLTPDLVLDPPGAGAQPKPTQ